MLALLLLAMLGCAHGRSVAMEQKKAVAMPSGERLRRSVLLVVSGGVAAALAKTAVAPLERIKLLRQVGAATGGLSLSGTLVKIVRDEGVRGLWRGNIANVCRAFPQKGMLLMSADLFCELVGPLCDAVPWLPNAATLGGALAGVASSLVSYPLDVVFTQQAGRLCAVGGAVGDACVATAGPIATMRFIVASGGFSALYVGAAFTLLSSLPYEGIKFGTFDWLKQQSIGATGRQRALLEMCAGAGAGAAAHTATYPLDTIRRNLQMTAGQISTGPKPPGGALGSAWVVARGLCAKGGIGSLYKGLPVTIIRTLPNTGLQFFFYQQFKRSLKLDTPLPPAKERAMRRQADACPSPFPEPISS